MATRAHGQRPRSGSGARDRQLVVVNKESSELQATGEQEIQLEEDWTDKPDVNIKTMNVVGTVDLKTQLDLKVIALHARNAEYNPKRFSAVVMRLRDPKTTALIFSSGKLVITGANTEEKCRLAGRKFTRVIQKLNFPAKFDDFKVRNMMATCDIHFPVRLEGILNDQPRFCSYEPELFPGLIYKLMEPKVTLLIFVSGKMVICGARSTTNLHEAVDKMYPVLLQYKKMTEAPSLSTGKPTYEENEDVEELEPRALTN